MSDISNNIKRLRELKRMNQAQLAEKIGFSSHIISNWESGILRPDLKDLEKLSTIFNIPIEELLYPQNQRKEKRTTLLPLNPGFVVTSIALYFILLVWGGSLFAVPLLKKLLGGGINEEFLYFIYWGLILLVGYLAICTALISEYILAHASQDAQENPNQDAGLKGDQ